MASGAVASVEEERIVGDYVLGQQIGSGSFSTVWHGRHQVHGTEVAVKEIVTSRLNKKLKDSLMSEIYILKRINHPNIVCLHDIIEDAGKIFIVLEYCKDGDLSVYLQRVGKVPESIAKNFMQQLAAGLKVLRDNNLIHRDLKPQNLLLSTNGGQAVLKIADFGFARPLQPRGLAETLCGSPLYMAPEIMQLQKYDAKADLWSVGAILFQFVTGKTPFTGLNQIQLLQNILKSNELHFPAEAVKLSAECKDLCQKLLRRNPLERLTFEEFFNHPFVSKRIFDEPLRGKFLSRSLYNSSFTGGNHAGEVEENAIEDCFPFLLDDDSCGPDYNTSKKDSILKPAYVSFLPREMDSCSASSKPGNNLDISLDQNHELHGADTKRFWNEKCKSSDDDRGKIVTSIDLNKFGKAQLRVIDSVEMMVDQDYVLVASPPLDDSSSSAGTYKWSQMPHKSQKLPGTPSNKKTTVSAPVRISGAIKPKKFDYDNPKISVASPGSIEMEDAEQPSLDCMTRLKSLQDYASALAELVSEKVLADKQLEAFSIQLVILAIWKRALHICHAQAASASEGSPSHGSTIPGNWKNQGDPYSNDCNILGPKNASVLIEREFLREVEKAEEFAKAIEPGASLMPDAMEIIFQSALSLGRNGGVDELIGNMENASTLYSNAARLLSFLLVEAPALILNPPFSLTSSDRYRLRTYIDILTSREGHCRPQCDSEEHTPS